MPNPTVDQQMAIAKQKMQQEMPDQMAATSVSPMGPITKALQGLRGLISGGQTQAITSPFTNKINYDPDAMAGQSQNEVTDTLAHELTHVRQGQGEPWYKPYLGLVGIGPHYSYGQDPDELEAFQTMADRALKEGRSPNPMPNFSSPGWRDKGDVQLMNIDFRKPGK